MRYDLVMASPLEKFNKGNPGRFKVLADIPKWERESLFRWLYLLMVTKTSDMFGTEHTSFNYGILRSIETKHRILISDLFGNEPNGWINLRAMLEDFADEDPEKFILFLELVVIYVRDQASKSLTWGSTTISDEKALERLDSILNNGSKWRVVKKYQAKAGLIEVVNEKLIKKAEEIDNDDLTEAWEEAFKPTPNPELAIQKAQSAVEHVASEYKLTSASTKVFGTLLGDIRANASKSYISIAKPEYDLSNELSGEKSTEADINDLYTQWFWTGMNLIQKSNPKRHKSEKTNEFKVSPDAAKQAVLIATIICELIKEGYIAKINKKNPKTQSSDKS
jgi:hypothetical protein